MNFNSDGSIIKSNSDRESVYRSDRANKPAPAAQGGKDFKKILGAKDEREQHVAEDDAQQSQESQQAISKERKSPFDLAPAAPAKTEKAATKQPSTQEMLQGEDLSTPKSELAVRPAIPQPLVTQAKGYPQANESKGAMLTPEQLMASVQQNKPRTNLPETGKGTRVGREESKIGSKGEEKNVSSTAFAYGTVQQPTDAQQGAVADIDPDQGRQVEQPRTVDWEYARGDEKQQSNALFSREQPDLAAVNPFTVNMPTENIATAPVAPRPVVAPISADLQLLINELAREISGVKDQGLSETTVELKSPLFDGARLVLTSTDSARNEFNIKFENLSQAAQLVLNNQSNRSDLMSNLERQGYNVHIFVATTFDERAAITANADNTPNREREGGQQQQQRRGNRSDEELAE
jgi:hypothetical protein